MLSGNNGILQKSTDAKQNSERAEAKEQAQMDIMEYITDKKANHQDASLDDTKIQEILSDNKSYVKEAGDTSFTTKKGEYVIPYSELYQSSNVTPSEPETPTNNLATLKAKIEAQSGNCMIDENENIIPIDKWRYQIIAGTDTCKIEGYEDEDEGNVYNAYNGQILESGKLEYNIPVFIKEGDKVYQLTILGNYALTGVELKSIQIPNGVESIGYDAFGYCPELISVTIPDSVTSIGECAFGYSSKLSHINLPRDITSIEKDTFHNCELLSNITIPNNVTSIGYRAFCGCTGLTSVIIPNTVTTIDSAAFQFVNKSAITNNSSASGYPWGAE